MNYKVLPDRLKLLDSYLVPKARYEAELNVIRYNEPKCPVWKRSIGSMRREWAAHDLAYSLGIRRDKTADCDLNYNPKWYHNLLYGVVGTIALWLVS